MKLGTIPYEEIAAFHESGHVVAADLLGWTVQSAQINPAGREGWAGVVEVVTPEDASVWDELFMDLAGIAAEVLFGPLADSTTTWADVIEGRFFSVGARDLWGQGGAVELAEENDADLGAVWAYTVDRLRGQGAKIQTLARELRAPELGREGDR